LGLVQDSKDFIENLVVEIDEKNKGRLNFLLPPTLIRQLIQTAVQIQFR
jgi:phage tail sheath gpL-like